MTKREHADLIHAWADGAEIQSQDSGSGLWYDRPAPGWNTCVKYRIKPDPPREPVRAWGTPYRRKDGTGWAFYDTEETALSCATSSVGIVPLIEAGWCQMINHDGRDQCPVVPRQKVVYRDNEGITDIAIAEYLIWSCVTHYAVILEPEK